MLERRREVDPEAARGLTACRIRLTFAEMQGPNPSISGDAVRQGLGPDDPKIKSERQAALDESERRELERAEYYGDTPAIPKTAATEVPKRRTILDRLFRR
jgi:hypothetical protein